MKIACDYGDMPEVPREDYDEEKSDKAYKGCFWSLVLSIVTFVIVSVLLLTSCTTTKYVPVVQTNTEHHWHTDSVKEKDSTYHEKTTTIMQLDSAAMAKYGIRLQKAERAWLVKTEELQRQIERLEAMSQSKDSVHDSIPVPYPVETIKEVPASLSWWKRVRLWLGNIVLLALLGVVVYYGYRFYKVWRFRL
jgi:hypothetical protein